MDQMHEWKELKCSSAFDFPATGYVEVAFSEAEKKS